MSTLEQIPCPKCAEKGITKMCNGKQGLTLHDRWEHRKGGREVMMKAGEKALAIKRRRRALGAYQTPPPPGKQKQLVVKKQQKQPDAKQIILKKFPAKRVYEKRVQPQMPQAIFPTEGVGDFSRFVLFLKQVRAIELALQFTEGGK